MASIVSAGTTSATALNMSGDTSGVLQLASNNGTVAVTVNTSQNVGVGTASPDTRITTYQAGDGLHVKATNNTFYSAMGVSAGASAGYFDVASATNMLFTRGGTESMRVDSSGRLLVGATTSTYGGHALQYNPGVAGWAAAVINSKTDNSTGTNGFLIKYSNITPVDAYQIFLCQSSDGTNRFFVQNNGTTGGTSDERLKKNIATARDGYLEDLSKIRVVKYNWNEQPEGTPKELGWIAQEVEQVFPQMISTDAETGYKSVKYSVFVPMLIKAVQELTAKVTALEAKVGASA
jgi:hypothetical protein